MEAVTGDRGPADGLDVFEVGETITFEVWPHHRQRRLPQTFGGGWVYDGRQWVRLDASGTALATVVNLQGRIWHATGREGYRAWWCCRLEPAGLRRLASIARTDPHRVLQKTDGHRSRRTAMQLVEDVLRVPLTYVVLGD